MSEIYMMVTICNRKQMQKFAKFYKQNHVDTGNISLAMGTAASDVLDYFGLEEDGERHSFLSGHTSHLENREKGIADGIEN